MFTERTSAGLDVHARSVAATAIDGVTGELFQAKLTPVHDHVRSWLQTLPGPVAVAYEAGPTGFGLYRALTEAGIRCVVAAPSKLQRPSGDRVKTDFRDAAHLARLLRLDEIHPVAVPTVTQEAARDLIRAREACRSDLMLLCVYRHYSLLEASMSMVRPESPENLDDSMREFATGVIETA
ncbi:MAG: transposase, partial [Actinomycetes bacterium]|nr:transposase [Actinomycetes bacterium]